jgi:hypothetical protein
MVSKELLNKKSRFRLEDLHGFFKYQGRPVLDEILMQPVGYTQTPKRKTKKMVIASSKETG